MSRLEELRRRSVETAATYNQGNIANLDDAMTRRLIASTVMTESSGGNLRAMNAQGYAGRYQAGAQWLADAGYVDADRLRTSMRGYRSEWAWADAGHMREFLADPSNWRDGLSMERYLASPELQDRAFRINSDAAYQRAIREGVLSEDDSPERIAGFLKARHISGYGGARAAVTGGREIADANGTSNYDYYNDIARNRDGLNAHVGRPRDGTERSEPAPNARRQDPERNAPQAGRLLRQGSVGPEVRELQTALGALGYRGADGQPLAVDSDFGRNTDHAVREFQVAHGLEPVDGKVGPDTRAALAHAAQRSLVSEATHPNHDLYQAIGRELPEGTIPQAAANITLQALENGITSPDKLQGIAVRGNDVHLQGPYPGARVAVDLAAPTPDLQAMSDHMRQQTQERAQEQNRQQQIQQPQAIAV